MRRTQRIITLISLLCLCALPSIETTATEASSTLVQDVSVIDVVAGEVLPHQSVLIFDGAIQALGPTESVSFPASATIIDGSGLFLMPGLFDAHVHYVDPDTFGNLLVANGVVYVRDTGMPNEVILPIRDALNAEELLGPEMSATGYVLDGNPPLIPPVSIGIRTPEEARQIVHDQAIAGVDMIKVYSKLRSDLLAAIVEEAAALGLKVIGHVPDAVTIQEAAALGLASSEHFFGFDKLIGRLLGENVRSYYAGMGTDVHFFLRLDEVDQEALAAALIELREHGLTVCPTVATFEAGTRASTYMTGVGFEHEEYVSQELLDTWHMLWPNASDEPAFIWEAWASLVAILNKMGIPLMVGTDLSVPGVLPGFSVHDEMAIWQHAGIPAADVLRSATHVPATFMGVQDRLGSLQAGKTASMVLLRANPLEDVNNVREIEGVFLQGRYFDRAALDRLLEQARAQAVR